MTFLRSMLLSCALLFPASYAAAADPGPAATIQTLPIGRILQDFRAAAALIADDAGPQFLDEQLREWLGEKGFSGLDLARPITGYAVFDDKKPDNISFVLLVGVRNEEEFIDLLKRAGVEPEADEENKGFYKLGQFELPQGEEPTEYKVITRVEGNTAYVGFNVPAALLAPDKVYKTEQLLNPKETALFAYRQFNDRMSPEMIKANMKNLEDSLKQLKDDETFGDQAKIVLPALESLLKRMMQMNTDSKETGTRITLDTAGGELGISSYFVPKDGTDLAKLLAERKPSTNQFASLAGPTMVVGSMVQMPVGIKEVQDIILAALDENEKQMAEDPPPPYAKGIVDELMKGLRRTVKSGECDLAVTLSGPDKDGHYVGAAAMTFDDAAAVEKALKAAHKDFPADERDMFKFDVEKIGDLNVHSINPPEDGEPEGYSTLFGDRKIYVVFGPKAIYAAIGNGAIDSLKAAINGKPGEAAAFDLLINPKRLSDMVSVLQPGAGPMVEKIIGSDDKAYSAYKLSVNGGESLELKFSLNLKVLPRMMAGFFLAMRG